MPLSPKDRARIEAVPLCGPRTADHLEMIGVASFDELADADAHELRIRVNAHLGRPHINAMGVRAFENAIAAAIAERRKRSG
jgi:predicted RecB family nuclease